MNQQSCYTESLSATSVGTREAAVRIFQKNNDNALDADLADGGKQDLATILQIW